MRDAADITNRVQDAMYRGLIDIVSNFSRQFTVVINQIADEVVNKINSTMQTTNTRLENEVSNPTTAIQNEIRRAGHVAKNIIRVESEADADLSDDDSNLKSKMQTWRDKMDNRMKIDSPGNQQR